MPKTYKISAENAAEIKEVRKTIRTCQHRKNME